MATTSPVPPTPHRPAGPRPVPPGGPSAGSLAGPLAGPAGRVFDRPLTSYYLVLGVTLLLTVLGLLMVLSASSVNSFSKYGSSYTVFLRQATWVALGLPLLWVGSRLPPRTYRALAYPMLGVAAALLVLTLVPGVGIAVNGNQNWIALAGFRIQPSEPAKLALVLWGADLLVRKRRLLAAWKHLLVPLLPVAGGVTALVLFEGDLGTAVILLVVTGALLFVAGAPLRLFALLGLGGAGLVGYLVLTASYRLERFRSWGNPFADLQGSGWQAAHGIYALSSGGWWGLGLGASREKWGLLPEAHTDFIFAIIGEELGLVGTLVVLGLFGLLGYAGLRIAVRSTDPFVRLAAAAATAWLLVQALVNMGAVLGVLPIAGIPLPLVSYGGSAMLPTMLALGMLLSFARDEPGARAALAARRRRRGTRPGSRRRER